MKKIYSQPELELLVLTEDIVSTSGQKSFDFDANEKTEDGTWWD